MRDIRFRCKCLDNGEWKYGSLIAFHDWEGNRHVKIVDDVGNIYAADPATVGQYTGLKDKNSKEIYEGDVLRWFVNDLISTAPVEYRDGAFWMVRDINTGHGVWNDWLRGEYEIFGNIHDNPELLKKE